jgi:hypothetical protein
MPPVTEKGTGPLDGFLLTANGTLVGKNMSMIFQASVTKEQAKAMVFFNPNPGGRNFFDSFCDFGSAMGDILSGGLTKRFRDAAGYGDRVNTSSAAYGAGHVAGEVVNVAMSVVNPCALAGGMRTLFNAVHVGQAVGGSLNGIDNLRAGNYFGALIDFAGVGMNAGSVFRACFTGDMLIDTEHGRKRADAIELRDKLWSRNEFDPDGPIELKEVEKVFETVAPILNVHVGGQIIRTTREHPFYVEGRGWLAAALLHIGDLLRTRDGKPLRVEGVADSGQVTTVYNWRIADYHTYFVGSCNWGLSVWAHNTCRGTSAAGSLFSVVKGIRTVDLMATGWQGLIGGGKIVYALFDKAKRGAAGLLKIGSTASPNTIVRFQAHLRRAAREGRQIEAVIMEVSDRVLEKNLYDLLSRIYELPWDKMRRIPW